MRCPFCGGEMKQGVLRCESRTAPKWINGGEKPGFFGGGRVIRNTRISYPVAELGGFICERCGKAVIDVKL